ncbi:hypothetical protein ACI28F_005133 [Escherichia coli]|jgi:hypothetical protein|uniref:Uncharacterized protein n=6 Tax=Escherichia coli TaxID=562 RepID=A0A0D8WHW3_ECOLX|nr:MULTISPECIES: hypothetical protein [Enterobacteriaceae]EAA2335320.1 hypothetical protein [Shigella sonnei]EBH9827072.1 hypothetical protein [Salmonella enterica subsp. enterica serovar 4,[5],12:i:-]EBV5488748.1 hypothetical protein [Salmonella enterica subsp. enterica serovar Agona]EBW6620933.1 hypothetical protein [Salmonella enterica subsp. enterica serovar Typhimurium]EBY8086019.1 hypothetical protein [Salmonella enterica subsp. enterica serovar Banana]ECF2190669.1 hypothetical protein 
MKDEIQSMCLTPDIVKQFNTLLNTHCQSSEEALGMLSALCFELMMKCGVQSINSLMVNGMGISMQLQGIDIAERPGKNIH